MSKQENKPNFETPNSGGRFIRDPKTGKLTKDVPHKKKGKAESADKKAAPEGSKSE